MFRRIIPASQQEEVPLDRITSVLGPGVIWKGALHGSGGIRIEGNFEGDVALRGLLVVGETGKVTCAELRSNTVIVAGMVKGNINAERLEIRSTGRVWGDVKVVSFATEEGAFLRGQVTMEERLDLDLDFPVEEPAAFEPAQEGSTTPQEEQAPAEKKEPPPTALEEKTAPVRRKKLERTINRTSKKLTEKKK
jgi:cytoskeletal protein CcmA (bactofilin family)